MGSRDGSLLERLKGLLERTYGMPQVVDDIGRFVVGDAGYRRFYVSAPTAGAGAADGSGARTLVRETDDAIRLSIYYPDALIRCLEADSPERGVRESNVDAFATLIEELDHFLCIAERAMHTRPLSLFELELHANVSKYLVVARFMAGRSGTLGPRRRAWLRRRVLDKGAFCDEDPRIRQRYRDAAHWAGRFLNGFAGVPAQTRVAVLRRFHRAGTTGKLDLIQQLA